MVGGSSQHGFARRVPGFSLCIHELKIRTRAEFIQRTTQDQVIHFACGSAPKTAGLLHGWNVESNSVALRGRLEPRCKYCSGRMKRCRYEESWTGRVGPSGYSSHGSAPRSSPSRKRSRGAGCCTRTTPPNPPTGLSDRLASTWSLRPSTSSSHADPRRATTHASADIVREISHCVLGATTPTRSPHCVAASIHFL